MPELAHEYQMLAVDLRGHGLSSNPDHGYNWADDFSEDVVALISHLGLKDVVLVGHSLGAMVAIPTAAKLPDVVSGVVLEDPPVYGHENAYQSHWWKERLDFLYLSLEQKIERFLEAGHPIEMARAMAESKDRVSPGVLEEFLNGQTAYDVEDWLPKISCNVLMMIGNPEKGGVVSSAYLQKLTELFRFTAISEWHNAGHGLHEVDPARFANELKQFMLGGEGA